MLFVMKKPLQVWSEFLLVVEKQQHTLVDNCHKKNLCNVQSYGHQADVADTNRRRLYFVHFTHNGEVEASQRSFILATEDTSHMACLVG